MGKIDVGAMSDHMSRVPRALWVAAFLLASGCSDQPNCQTKGVEETLFAALRYNLDEAMARSDQQSLRLVAVAASMSKANTGIRAAVGKPIANEDEKYAAYIQSNARFSLNSLTERATDQSGKTHMCKANVRMDVALPWDLIKQAPNLEVNSHGEITGSVNVNFTVQPDLAGKNPFVLEAQWDDSRS